MQQWWEQVLRLLQHRHMAASQFKDLEENSMLDITAQPTNPNIRYLISSQSQESQNAHGYQGTLYINLYLILQSTIRSVYSIGLPKQLLIGFNISPNQHKLQCKEPPAFENLLSLIVLEINSNTRTIDQSDSFLDYHNISVGIVTKIGGVSAHQIAQLKILSTELSLQMYIVKLKRSIVEPLCYFCF